MLLSKVAIAAGGIWILVYFLGAIGSDPAILIGALAAIIGVSSPEDRSCRSTWLNVLKAAAPAPHLPQHHTASIFRSKQHPFFPRD